MFQTTKEAISWIESVKKFGDKLDLSRMELACKLLGHPELNLPVIHIAGTNGKGSTLTYIKEILLQEGYKVGTFTSPYIVHFNERITYNNKDITDEELMYYINKVKVLSDQVFKDYNQVITFFELVTLISFMYFNDLDVDYVLYEVGLGGRLDATNVLAPIFTVITTIGYDHIGVLGDTLELIAKEKLGIVKEGIPLVSSITQPKLLPIFKKYTKGKNAPYYQLDFKDIQDIKYDGIQSFLYQGIRYKMNMIGVHQVHNACVAIKTIKTMEQHDKVSVSEESIHTGLLKAHWPGRLEQFGKIYLDGAHNVDAFMVLKDTMETLFSDKKIKVLYTSMADKDYISSLKIIDKFAHEVYFTSFEYPRCETAKNLFDSCDIEHKFLVPDAYQALEQLKDLKDNEILLITGSLYFISYIRKALIDD